MHDTTAAYMAGIIDGEGCIYVNRRKCGGNDRRITPGFSLKVCVTTTDKVLVDFMVAEANLTSIHWKQPPGNRKRAALCTWNASYAECLLNDTLPFLIIKKPQAMLGLELISNLKLTKAGGVGNPVKPELIEFRERIKSEISKLNQRGRLCQGV